MLLTKSTLDAALAANADVIAEASNDTVPSASVPQGSAPPATMPTMTVPSTTSPPTTVAPSNTEPETSTGIDGLWFVDTDLGTFDYESATGSFAGFRVDEELQGIGTTTAVGRTGEIEGMLEIVGTTANSLTIDVDLSTLTTNDSRRDGVLTGVLNTDEFPIGTFVLTEPIDFGAEAIDGNPVSTTARGDLTIAGVTNGVEMDIDAQLEGDVIIVVGSTDVVFADFGVTAPSNPPLLSVNDAGVVETQLLFTRPG